MKNHLSYYSHAYWSAIAAVVMAGVGVFYPDGRTVFVLLSLWFVLSAIVNAVFLKAIK